MNPHPFRFPAGAVAPAIVALAGLTCEPAAGIQVDSAIIVLDPGAHETGMKAASELRTYVQKLCRREMALHRGPPRTTPADATLVLLACHDSRNAADLIRPDDGWRRRAPGTFVLRTGEVQGRPAVGVLGRDPMGILYGVYALIEEMGVTFTLSGDLLPPPAEQIALPKLERLYEPALAKRRGFQIPMLDVNSGIQSFPDYCRLIDQMVKLRLNYINFFFCAAEPWLDYTFRGEQNRIGDINSRQTGYLIPKRVVPNPSTDNIQIGRAHFQARGFMAPMELQEVRNREDGIAKFQDLMRRVIDYAHRSGIQIGLSTDLTRVPPNFAKHMRAPHMSNPDTLIFGQKVDPLDPVMLEHAEVMLRAVFETYSDIDELFIFNPEGYHYRPDAEALYAELKPAFANAKRTFERNWIETCPYARDGKTAEEIIEVDIAHFASARRGVALARRLRPDLTVGMAFLFRGYLLQDADKLIDRDVPFMEYQSSGVVAVKNDVNARYFAGMGERDRYIIARVDDDGSMFGVPFYLRQFEHDGLFREAAQAGVTGLAAQLWRVRGTEHHTRFLALGAWDPELTPEKFYPRYAHNVFGEQAAQHMLEAFEALEDCEQLLGWRGMKNFRWADGCRELAVLGPALLSQKRPYEGPLDPKAMLRTATCVTIFEDTRVPRDTVRPGKIDIFQEAVALLDRALQHMRAAEREVGEKGRSVHEYLVSKTGAYRAHLQMVALLCQGFAGYAEAFLEHSTRGRSRARALTPVSETFQKAERKARESAERAAEIVDHPSDLAVLFQVNRFNVEKVAKIAALVRCVKDYHHGKPWTYNPAKDENRSLSKEGWNN